ncbi:Copper oxidase (laccase) domain (YfiH) (PDB:1RV9) [Commensalibacter communis]|uniref:peptidoglycan editing factor PgeF n=1 Tax=Commensalibacter communis TaxID=2972786 RepID=UPI0022FF8651|nr:peptidoglycan editing factor PgeF [Commensalibacter communis]CAI3949080.1 Copper oxidase (laccase) domain (YfiH) (PDB:1RV9) [Commensalibacter communis]CAI3951574.1 Copper oxidase (laccase) domain (YfiH) (PDB:1RV9) [Commensalibacter communis]
MSSELLVIRHSLLKDKVRHGFFTRVGGVSQGGYASLNCGIKTEDKPEHIQENRHRVAQDIGVSDEYLWGGMQVHSAKVMHVTKENCDRREVDGGVTDDPDVAVSVLTADCGPVLFTTFDGRIVGAAHAGWRGAEGGILEETVTQMEALGAKSSEIIAVVGPCIDGSRYEVKEDMKQQVLDQDPHAGVFFKHVTDDQYLFDLGHYCVDRLRRRRVAIAALIGRDTLGDETHFFSHRRRTLAGGGPLGHQISVIACHKKG